MFSVPLDVYCENKKKSLMLWYMCSNAASHPNTKCKWLHASAMSSNRKVFDRVNTRFDSLAHVPCISNVSLSTRTGAGSIGVHANYEALGRQSWIWMRSVHNYGRTNWFTTSTWMRPDAPRERNGDAEKIVTLGFAWKPSSWCRYEYT